MRNGTSKMTLTIRTHWLPRQHATENKISALGVECTYSLVCAMGLLHALIALKKTELLSSNFTSNWNTISPEAQRELKCFWTPPLLRTEKVWWRSSQIPKGKTVCLKRSICLRYWFCFEFVGFLDILFLQQTRKRQVFPEGKFCQQKQYILLSQML